MAAVPSSPLNGVYVGYRAHGAGDLWRGYIGAEFVEVERGPRGLVQETNNLAERAVRPQVIARKISI